MKNTSRPPKRLRTISVLGLTAVAGLATATLSPVLPATAQGAPSSSPMSASAPLTAPQRADLYKIAQDTWKFYSSDLDPVTHLPLDNIGPGTTRGAYTSAANIGVYLDAVVSAGDLKLIDRPQERRLVSSLLTSVSTLESSHGFLLQWYDTSTGHAIFNPGQADCATETTPAQDNCFFLSAVDNGWYATGLMVARSALPELRADRPTR